MVKHYKIIHIIARFPCDRASCNEAYTKLPTMSRRPPSMQNVVDKHNNIYKITNVNKCT